MTSTQRIFFGAVASVLLVLGLVKAAESFDPVTSQGRTDGAGADDFSGSATTHLI